MSHLEIIIPFALPPAEHAKDLVKLLASASGSDGLAMLLSRSFSKQLTRYDDFSLQLPHEIWLSEKHHHNQLIHLVSQMKLALSEGYWFILNPVNLHIASNHLVLTDQRMLALSEDEAQVLFDIAQSCCQQAGLQLLYGDSANWFLKADAWADFVTATPDAACGHNIEIWSPKGQKAIAWRKLQNEIQMEWFIHPLQEQRQQRGAKVINGLWLWSGTVVAQGDHTFISTPLHWNPEGVELQQKPGITLIDLLSAAALANDWGSWAEVMTELELSWFKPLYSSLKTGQLRQVQLILSNSNTLSSVQTSSGSLRRFWRTATLNHLINHA